MFYLASELKENKVNVITLIQVSKSIFGFHCSVICNLQTVNQPPDYEM